VPSALNGVDKGSPGELLNALSVTLRQDFYIPPGIGVSPSNATEPTGAEEPICKLILVGASNLQKAAAHLENLRYTVVNLCVMGWVPTPQQT